MADEKKVPDKKPSPIEALEQQHLAASARLQKQIDGLMKDLRDSEAMAREIRARVMQLRREKLTASYAFDAARADLVAAEAKPKAA
jgi:hypothetical protein